MGEGNDLFVSKAAELVADHLQLFVKARGAKGGVTRVVAHAGNQRCARGGGVATGHQHLRCGAGGIGQVKVGKAGHFALAHRDATRDLAEVFAKSDLQDQSLHRPKAAVI